MKKIFNLFVVGGVVTFLSVSIYNCVKNHELITKLTEKREIIITPDPSFTKLTDNFTEFNRMFREICLSAGMYFEKDYTGEYNHLGEYLKKVCLNK